MTPPVKIGDRARPVGNAEHAAVQRNRAGIGKRRRQAAAEHDIQGGAIADDDGAVVKAPQPDGENAQAARGNVGDQRPVVRHADSMKNYPPP